MIIRGLTSYYYHIRNYRAAAFCLLFSAGCVFAQSSLNRIQERGELWSGHNNGLVILVGILAVIGVGLGFLIAYYVRGRGKVVEEERVYSKKNYDDECARCRVNAEEKALLGKLIAYLPDASKPYTIFQSIGIFERCVDAYVNSRMEALAASPKMMEDEDELLRFLRGKLEYNVLAPEQPLFSTRNIGTGQRVSLYRSEQHSAALAKNVRTVYVGEFYFTVRVFDETKMNLESFAGTTVTVAFLRSGDAAYSISVKALSVDGEAGQIRLAHTLDLKRSQKRQFMRLEVSSPMRYRVLETADKEKKPTSQMFQGRVVDISGGGLSFFADEALEAGDTILATVMLPGETLGGVKSKVLGVTPVEGKTAVHYRHHVQYIDIEQRQRERIIKFVFEKQRQMLQMR